MDKHINLLGQTVSYVQKRSRRARHLRLTISRDSGLVATLPWWMPEGEAEKFLLKKSNWILAKLKIISGLPPRTLPKLSKSDLKHHKHQALSLVRQRLEHFNRFYNFQFHKIAIRAQSSLWGSASQKGNLNFNYRIIFLPPELRDYLIVHELCHLGEFNHSQKFWALVAKTCPDYKNLRPKLKALN